MAEHDPIRIIRHTPEGLPDCGSFEVWFDDGRPSEYFYWDDDPGRRSVTRQLDQAEALERARRLARAEREKLEQACTCCDGTGWVCEDHPDQPWEGPHACSCGAAGAPCPHCNRPDDGEVPRLPPGFEPDGG